MRQSKWAPSIIPEGEDHNVYLVVDDFGYIGWPVLARDRCRDHRP
jgi:hypothetical protein